jgi:hypothetical protein
VLIFIDFFFSNPTWANQTFLGSDSRVGPLGQHRHFYKGFVFAKEETILVEKKLGAWPLTNIHRCLALEGMYPSLAGSRL